MSRLAIDFGTSNSAVGVNAGAPRLVAIEGAATTVPTAVFFDPHARETLFGAAAAAALIDGREGRFMRALKSVLGTPLMHERRVIAHERLSLVEVVARFLAILKARAEAETGQRFDAVLSGRPVRFHPDPDRDARAEADLRAAYDLAGFRAVDFMFEPEAAALTSGPLARGELGLVVDIGGGTSDFSLFETGPSGVRIVASHGIRLGGTDFDRALSLAQVMPRLGRGAEVRDTFGPGRTPAPAAIFNDLASWEKIAFLYGPQTLRLARDMARRAEPAGAFDHLVTVLEHETGHDVAFAVEAGKIAVNDGTGQGIDLSVIAPGMTAPLDGPALDLTLSDFFAQIGAAAAETLDRAGTRPDQVSRIVLVGGSSLMGGVTGTLARLCPAAQAETGAAFTAVAEGLARAA